MKHCPIATEGRRWVRKTENQHSVGEMPVAFCGLSVWQELPVKRRYPPAMVGLALVEEFIDEPPVRPDEMPVKAQVEVQGFRPLHRPAFHSHFVGQDQMSVWRWMNVVYPVFYIAPAAHLRLAGLHLHFIGAPP
ncbi:hypothetical protein HAX54_004958, partial [Datura stramonium]|nr:hypothetical protein [Datura stramonium]